MGNYGAGPYGVGLYGTGQAVVTASGSLLVGFNSNSFSNASNSSNTFGFTSFANANYAYSFFGYTTTSYGYNGSAVALVVPPGVGSGSYGYVSSVVANWVPSFPGILGPTGRWVLDEDEAMKNKLSGFAVLNYADNRPIPVQAYFRFPDGEERTKGFPHILIDLVEINFDPTRVHHAPYFKLPNISVEEAPPQTGFDWIADDYPLPWTLVYQISAFSRQPTHDRQMQMLMYRLFPESYGSLDMTAIDGTIRRADLESVVKRDMIDDTKKRQYRTIFTVGVSSEFFLNEVVAIQQVTSVSINVNTL